MESSEEEQVEDYEESDYLKQWRALPKASRERLTKKQIRFLDRPDTMFESLAI
jgi:hypothetical protein